MKKKNMCWSQNDIKFRIEFLFFFPSLPLLLHPGMLTCAHSLISFISCQSSTPQSLKSRKRRRRRCTLLMKIMLSPRSTSPNVASFKKWSKCQEGLAPRSKGLDPLVYQLIHHDTKHWTEVYAARLLHTFTLFTPFNLVNRSFFYTDTGGSALQSTGTSQKWRISCKLQQCLSRMFSF